MAACYTTSAAMNIVMIGPFGLRPKGTMAVRALPLARALSARGHRVVIILPPWANPDDSGVAFSDDNVRVINIVLPPRIPGLWHVMIVWRLLRAALAQHPDVVHCFKPKAYSGLAALALWLAHKLHLSTARVVVDTDDWEGKGGWNEIERYSFAQKAFFAWQERWGLTHAAAVTVASRALQTLVWSLGGAPQRTFYVPNGVGRVLLPDDANGLPQRREPAHATSSPMSQTVLLYTRFFEFTVERVVAIIGGVLAAAPGAHVVVVGAGLFAEEKQFVQQIAAAGLAERVTYAGWRTPAELPAYFASAAVAIYPFDDTLINRTKCAVKLTELLAAGVPVVAERVGQNAEYIEHGVSGILIEPGDTQSFVAAVVGLLANEESRRLLGENAQRRMLDQFTWARLAARAEDAYTCR